MVLIRLALLRLANRQRRRPCNRLSHSNVAQGGPDGSPFVRSGAAMPQMPPTFRPHGAPSKTENRRAEDERRGSAAERGYDRRWSKASASFRAENPLCQYCELDGRISPAALTDHLYPHRVFPGVFWVKHWWVASCKACHDGFKQRIERAGKAELDALARRLGRPVLP